MFDTYSSSTPTTTPSGQNKFAIMASKKRKEQSFCLGWQENYKIEHAWPPNISQKFLWVSRRDKDRERERERDTHTHTHTHKDSKQQSWVNATHMGFYRV
jgi:hypothetical protein